jgi:hypothetical protein
VVVQILRRDGHAVLLQIAGCGANYDANALPLLKNLELLEWVKTIPALGRNSPEYAILCVDPNTNLTTLMLRTPVAVHIKPHTHDLAEAYVVLIGGTHVFKSNDVLYRVERRGFLRMPAGVFMRRGLRPDHRP